MTNDYKATIPAVNTRNEIINNIIFFSLSLYHLFTSSFVNIKSYKCTQFKSGGMLTDSSMDIASPSRKLADLFLWNLPWNNIKKELGGKLYLLDIGCGSGTYCQRFRMLSHDNISSYFGLDVMHNKGWEVLTKKYPNSSFGVYDGVNIKEIIPNDINIIISYSTLEHVKHDISLLNSIDEYIRKTNRDIIQIHLFPSLAGIITFGKHGFRQYSQKTIEVLSSIFRDNSYSTLYKLGSAYSILLHILYISLPRLFLRRDLRDYECFKYPEISRKVLEHDIKKPFVVAPSFYALVIHSNYKNRIF